MHDPVHVPGKPGKFSFLFRFAHRCEKEGGRFTEVPDKRQNKWSPYYLISSLFADISPFNSLYVADMLEIVQIANRTFGSLNK